MTKHRFHPLLNSHGYNYSDHHPENHLYHHPSHKNLTIAIKRGSDSWKGIKRGGRVVASGSEEADLRKYLETLKGRIKEETELDEVAPPGREDQVKELKKKFSTASAFKIAWASYNKGKKHLREIVEDTDPVMTTGISLLGMLSPSKGKPATTPKTSRQKTLGIGATKGYR